MHRNILQVLTRSSLKWFVTGEKCQVRAELILAKFVHDVDGQLIVEVQLIIGQRIGYVIYKFKVL